ncbi:hypothetical protein [Nostoc sp.]|uniref:hypothetical protein n=1 Tax=Nostoc sp. TaxID=1180 RepID=UPI002FF5B287
MNSNNDKGELTLAIGLLIISLGILGIGTTLPKKTTEGMTICNAKVGDTGYMQGLITDISKEAGKLSIQLTEGTAGCNGLLLAASSNSVNLKVGNRIKVKVKVVGDGMYNLINQAEIDPTVVDTLGNTEETIKLELTFSSKPELYGSDKYAVITVNTNEGRLKLKIDKEKLSQIRLNQPGSLTYYASTKVVSSVDY